MSLWKMVNFIKGHKGKCCSFHAALLSLRKIFTIQLPSEKYREFCECFLHAEEGHKATGCPLPRPAPPLAWGHSTSDSALPHMAPEQWGWSVCKASQETKPAIDPWSAVPLREHFHRTGAASWGIVGAQVPIATGCGHILGIGVTCPKRLCASVHLSDQPKTF